MHTSATLNQAWSFCDEMLVEVSRSFALIIPRCPPPIDRAMCVAYLLCRIADTIEDDPALDEPQRNALYDRLLHALDHPADVSRVAAFQQSWPRIPQNEYGRLIAGLDLVLAAFHSLAEQSRTPIAQCVHDMTAGMRTIRPMETRNGIAYFCRALQDLDRYCHYVAGTVGIMSTALFEMCLSAMPDAFAPTSEWREEGRRMGLGLQMTNIIKDCNVDAERGVSYIPAAFTNPNSSRFELLPIARSELIRHTIAHLDAAMRYVTAIPSTEQGIRTFLLGSIFPAIATLDIAARADTHQPKLDRTTMAEILSIIDRDSRENVVLNDYYAKSRCSVLMKNLVDE